MVPLEIGDFQSLTGGFHVCECGGGEMTQDALRLIKTFKLGYRKRGVYLCLCGKVFESDFHDVRSGHTKSCGCRKRPHGHSRPSRTYNTWQSMKKRCASKDDKNYVYYGARGIRFCERWSDFSTFLADMGVRPEGKTLDRIDTDGNYEPNNCRWATPKEQWVNRRRTGSPLSHLKESPRGA